MKTVSKVVSLFSLAVASAVGFEFYNAYQRTNKRFTLALAPVRGSEETSKIYVKEQAWIREMTKDQGK